MTSSLVFLFVLLVLLVTISASSLADEVDVSADGSAKSSKKRKKKSVKATKKEATKKEEPNYNTLKEFYEAKRVKITEGYSTDCASQEQLMRRWAKKNNIVNVLEIGFNAGHSAELWLSSKPNIKVTSFDIGTHTYLNLGKNFIDRKFPDRHTLILGDSRDTLPKFIEENPGVTFDLLFIDGGHAEDVPLKDLKNCRALAHKDSLVVMDDTMYDEDMVKWWTEAPTEVWKAAKVMEYITEIATIDYPTGHGLSYGKYTFPW